MIRYLLTALLLFGLLSCSGEDKETQPGMCAKQLDCDSSPADPQMGDIGILASLDPVALDKACTDLVRSSEDHGKIHLIERIDSRQGMHTLDYAEQIGLGSQQYELVRLD